MELIVLIQPQTHSAEKPLRAQQPLFTSQRSSMYL